MLIPFQLENNRLPAVSPWDSILSGIFSPAIVSQIAQAYAAKKKLGVCRKLRPIIGQFRIIYASADLGGNQPTLRLIPVELVEMAKSGADVWVLCIAKPSRLADFGTDCPCRTLLKNAFGPKFLELGRRSDKQIADDQLGSLQPHVVITAGFWQDGDRPGIFKDQRDFLLGQYVAHAGTTGSSRVDFVLGNTFVLSDDIMRHYSEKAALLDGPFLPNSCRMTRILYSNNYELCKQLRADQNLRSSTRRKRCLPHDSKLIINISKPNRLKKPFFNMMFKILTQNPNACLVLIDHDEPDFKSRTKHRFLVQGLPDRVLFSPFLDPLNGDLQETLALCDLCLDTLGPYTGHTAASDSIYGCGDYITVEGDTVPGRIAADLNRCFGTPENILKDDSAALARVNQLLQDPKLLAEAHAKAAQCSDTWSMYDNELRARQVLSALQSAYESKEIK
jgi:hypothetical protein